MSRHRIYARHGHVPPERRLDLHLVKRVVRLTLDAEGVDTPCEVSVLVTDDHEIRAVNREFRHIDAATDVLSFPMQGLTPGAFSADGREVSPETGLLPLGDIVLSYEHVERQAAEYGHTRERETAYLTIHSALHLLGYDHVDEGREKRRMRAREKAILQQAGYGDGL